MCEFIRVNSQEVKHKTGYRVYSVGREFLEYKDADVTYKIHSEFGGGLEKNNIKMYIFTSHLYNNYDQVVIVSEIEKKTIFSKVIKAAKFLTTYPIEIVDE